MHRGSDQASARKRFARGRDAHPAFGGGLADDADAPLAPIILHPRYADALRAHVEAQMGGKVVRKADPTEAVPFSTTKVRVIH